MVYKNKSNPIKLNKNKWSMTHWIIPGVMTQYSAMTTPFRQKRAMSTKLSCLAVDKFWLNLHLEYQHE